MPLVQLSELHLTTILGFLTLLFVAGSFIGKFLGVGGFERGDVGGVGLFHPFLLLIMTLLLSKQFLSILILKLLNLRKQPSHLCIQLDLPLPHFLPYLFRLFHRIFELLRCFTLLLLKILLVLQLNLLDLPLALFSLLSLLIKQFCDPIISFSLHRGKPSVSLLTSQRYFLDGFALYFSNFLAVLRLESCSLLILRLNFKGVLLC